LNRLAIAVFLMLVIAGTFYVGYTLFKPTSSLQIVIAGTTLNVEIAKTTTDQQKGLSDRDSMAPDHGMLFVFDSEGKWSFWMKGMRFSLDIIWFDSHRQAVYIQQDLAPCTPSSCPVYMPTVSAMYVLEVNAGFVQSHNISLGDTFNFVK
jgi:uncharacterized membrane protein (UPF0127 family)